MKGEYYEKPKVCRDTLYQWEKEHPEFFYIKKVGKEASLYKYEQLIMGLANGLIEGNSTAAVWYGKNMFGWTDKQQVEQSGTINITIDKDDAKL